MPDQNRSPDGIPRKDEDRPSPDVEGYATDGQSNARGKGAPHEQGEALPTAPEGGDSGEVGRSPGAGPSVRNRSGDPDAKSVSTQPAP